MIKLPVPIELLVNSNFKLDINGADKPVSIMLGEFNQRGPFVIIGPGDDNILEFSYEHNLGLSDRVRVYSVTSKYDKDKECSIIQANIACILPQGRHLMNFIVYQKADFLPKGDFIEYTVVPSCEMIKKEEDIIEITKTQDYEKYLADLILKLERRY